MENNEGQSSSDDCCGSGCNPCILDVRKQLSEQKETSPNKNVLSQSNYVKFVVNDVKEIAEEYLLFTMNLKDLPKEDAGIILNIGQYVIVRIANISRSLTPISWSNTSFTLLVKIYKGGKMSQLIKEKNVDDEIDVRGPYGDFLYHRNSIGSGIATLYPIINSIIHDELEDTRVHLISSFRFFATVPFKNELRRLTDYWNFSCTLFLTQENNNNILTGVKLINNSRICEHSIKTNLEKIDPETALILICGTKEFNNMLTEIIERIHYPNYYVFK